MNQVGISRVDIFTRRDNRTEKKIIFKVSDEFNNDRNDRTDEIEHWGSYAYDGQSGYAVSVGVKDGETLREAAERLLLMKIQEIENEKMEYINFLSKVKDILG